MSKSRGKFAVVVFDEYNETDVVPTSWLTNDGKMCWWPNYRAPSKLISAVRQMEVPNRNSFTIHKSRVLQTYSNYDTANKYAKKAQHESELSSEGTTPPKPSHTKVPACKLFKEELDNSSSENECESYPKLPKFPRLEEVNPFAISVPETDKDVSNQRSSKQNRNSYEGEVSTARTGTDPVGYSTTVNLQSIPKLNEYLNIQHEYDTSSTTQQQSPNVPFYIKTPTDLASLHPQGFPNPKFQSEVGYSTMNYSSIPAYSSTENNQQGSGYFPPRANLDEQAMQPNTADSQLYSIFNDHQEEHETRREVIENRIEINRQPIGQSEFEKWMIRNLTILKASVKQLQETVDVLLSRGNSVKETEEVVATPRFSMLPIENVLGLESMQDALTDMEYREKMVKFLSLRGGKDIGNCTRRILGALMSDEFAERFSWLGSRGDKMSFSKSFLKPILYDAVRRNNVATDSQIETIVKDWLRNAKKRLQSFEKRLQEVTVVDGDDNGLV